jgi:hypothetical protein
VLAIVLVTATAVGALALRATAVTGSQSGTVRPMKAIRFGELADGNGGTLSDAVSLSKAITS